jgi:CBS domain-containing protein
MTLLLKDIMKKDLVTTSPGGSVRDAAKMLIKERVGCLLVTEKEELKGIVTKSDIVRALVEEKDPDATKIKDIMKEEVTTCNSDSDFFSGSKKMTEKGIKRLPILSDGKLAGLVSITELAPSLTKEMEKMTSYDW